VTDDDPYSRPELYDLEYADYREDIDHYLALARGRRTVLELGCGTGRLALPLARMGCTVHGVDLSPEMLAAFERKLRAEPDAVRLRVRTQLGDFRTFEAPGRHELVVLPFNAIHHCATVDDVRSTLASARAALAPRGIFALDAYLPDAELYSREPGAKYEMRTFVHPLTGGDLLSWEEGWWDAATRTHHVVYVYVHQDEGGREDRIHLALHMYEIEELEDLVEGAGFEILSAASDFRGSPIGAGSLKWVAVLRPSRTA
jgi:SAM-dependent methyltransferase